MKIEIEQYLTKNYYELHKIAKKYTKNEDWASELLHEVIIQLYEKDEHIVKTDDNSIKYYIIRILMVNWCYPTSPFYRKYKKIELASVELKGFEMFPEEEDAFDIEELYRLLEENYSELDWFHKALFDTYMSLNKSMIAVSRKTNIPFQSISRYIKTARQQVKNNILKGLYE